MTTVFSDIETRTTTAAEENAAYKKALKDAATHLTKDADIQKYDPEWLVRRGNYLTIITPAVAQELLERNVENRKPKARAMAQYARDMEAGEWNPDASDIKVTKDGLLIDGQNRLMACIQAGVPFPTLLRTGVDKDAREHVDQGVKRTAGDALKMAGVSDATVIAAAINIRERYVKTLNQHGGKQMMTYARGLRITMTHAEVLAYLNAHPSLQAMTRSASAMYKEGPGVPRTVYLAAMSWFAESSEKMAREFAENFTEGKSTGTGDPILALTRYAARAKSPTELGRKSANRNLQHLGAFVRAWNFWIEGGKLDKIVIRDSDLLEMPV